LSTLTLSNDSLIIDDEVQVQALELVEEAEDSRLGSLQVSINGRHFDVPPELSDLLVFVIERAAQGGAIHIRTMPDELTTTVAADLLGVSRPTLMKMINDKQLPSHSVGTHRRVRSKDVIRLRQDQDSRRREAVAALQTLIGD
jgi:excisionase family DNA binding protein